MIAFRIRFRSKELFAQGKLFLGAVWFSKKKKKKNVHIVNRVLEVFFGHFVHKVGNFWFILCLLMPFWTF